MKKLVFWAFLWSACLRGLTARPADLLDLEEKGSTSGPRVPQTKRPIEEELSLNATTFLASPQVPHKNNEEKIVVTDKRNEDDELISIERIFGEEKSNFEETTNSFLNEKFEDVVEIFKEDRFRKGLSLDEGSGFSDETNERLGRKESSFEAEGSGFSNYEINFNKEELNNSIEDTIQIVTPIPSKFAIFGSNESKFVENITPVIEISTPSSLIEDEWLKIINSSPKDEEYEDKVLDIVDELLGLNPEEDNSKQPTNIEFTTEIDPFEDSSKEYSIQIQKVLGNGKFDANDMNINTEEITTQTESLLSVIHPNLEPKQTKSLEMPRNEFEYHLNENLLEYEGIAKTSNNAFLKSESTHENIEICFSGTIGYQFMVKMKEDIDSPKYLNEFDKICAKSYEPILVLVQESSRVEFKFEIVHEIVSLRWVRINVRGKTDLDETFAGNLTIFDSSIGNRVVVDEFDLEKLEKYNKSAYELLLKLFSVNLATEMYINGRLVAEIEDQSEESGKVIILSTSISAFCLFFFIVFAMIYQLCLKNHSRKMIYSLTHR